MQELLKVGVASSNSVISEVDHFNLTENLTDPNYILSKSILQFISSAIN